ncbi:MAG: alkaline phosphatase family protein [Ignavibacteriaceae bacterium]
MKTNYFLYHQKHLSKFFYLLLLLNFFSTISFAQNETLPGKYETYTLLHNGWKLTPAGRQVGIGPLPLNMVVTKNGRYAITSNSGMGENSLSVVDLKNAKEVQRVIVSNTWYGLVFNGNDSKLFVSGGNNNLIYIYNFYSGRLALKDSIIIGEKFPKENISVTGIDFVKRKNYLLAVSKESKSIYVCDVKSKKVIQTVKLNGECYDVKANHAGTFAYVSIWGKSSVAEINLNNFKVTNEIEVGDHPCQIIITKDDSRLFVADANNNSTSVIDLRLKKEVEKLNSSLTADAPFGSTPDALCFNGNESVLMVANANNNYIALFNISKKNKSKSIGFIPAGWYPTAVKFVLQSNEILIANGKGLSSLPNPEGPKPGIRESKVKQYIGILFNGAVSIIKFPGKKNLAAYSAQVYENTPYISKEKNWVGIQNVIPDKHNLIRSEKIKHVFYIIKENRTYDQVFGDLPEGNGDSALCFFPRNITPNQHNLAENFTLYDNFYDDAEVSASGHNWSTAAYATDYVDKLWPVNYGGRGQQYNFEGGSPIAAPSSGYIWNDVVNHHLSMRNFGEFTEAKNGKYVARDADLNKYTSHIYPGWDLNISDVYRYEQWEKEFDEYAKGDSLPDFTLMRLPNDHTWGTKKGALTPQAYVALNDYAVGLIVQKISESKYWKNSIIFILEDDAQNGSDHVDAHRSTLLVISPYIKRHYVDHTMYSTSSVLKTMELILGLPPMTQYDLSATPILFSITDKPDFSSFSVIKPQIDVNEKNTADAYGAEKCEHLNFTREDAVPENEFNEILWKDIKGNNTPMPAPVHSAFVRVKDEEKDSD